MAKKKESEGKKKMAARKKEEKRFLKAVTKAAKAHPEGARRFAISVRIPKPKPKKGRRCVRWGIDPATGKRSCIEWG